MKTRLAPTPSGYLHLGNAFNFVLTWALSRRAGGSLRLRIDDIDQERARPEFVEDVFRSLEWLGVDWDHGPTGPDEFYQRFSQRYRIDRYEAVLQQMRKSGLLFGCTCTRKQIRETAGTSGYAGTCRELQRDLDEQETAWRLNEASAAIPFPILRQKNGDPAYMLASVVDDVDYGITHVVRGEDLLASTQTQGLLSGVIEVLAPFSHVLVHHHPLLVDEAGEKLSKSAGSSSLASMRKGDFDPLRIHEKVDQYLEAGLPVFATLRA